MTIRRLERRDWIGFCAYASRGLIGRQADIEVAQIVDADDVREIVTLREPPMLPDPHALGDQCVTGSCHAVGQ
jgi:hypothetical protein